MIPKTNMPPPENQAFFFEDEFRKLIDSKSYDYILEKAIKCPCKEKSIGSARATCRNCGGRGWAFINPQPAKAVLQSMNFSNKYLEWTEANMGLVKITFNSNQKLAFMDRLTHAKAITLYSEIIYPIQVKNKYVAFTSYRIESVENCFLFVSDTEPFEVLTNNDYSIEGNKIEISKRLQDNPVISIRYMHHPAYHIIDIPRDIMQSPAADNELEKTDMPLFAIGRITQKVFENTPFQNYNQLIDNSNASNTTVR